MAKKSAGTSKTNHIREYLRENPGAAPSAIVEGLAARGISVSQSLAAKVKYTSGAGTKRKKKKTARKQAAQGGSPRTNAAPSRGGAALTVDDLVEAKKLVDELGGIAEARKALDALATLQK